MVLAINGNCILDWIGHRRASAYVLSKKLYELFGRLFAVNLYVRTHCLPAITPAKNERGRAELESLSRNESRGQCNIFFDLDHRPNVLFPHTMSRALEKTETGNSKEQPDANQEGILAVTFATLTRTAIFTLKGLPKGIMKSALKKRAFLFIGKRTVTATMSPSVKASKKVHSSRVSDLIRTCLMGLSVFGVYDWIIHRAESNQKDKSENDNPATSPKPPKTILTVDLKLVWSMLRCDQTNL